MTTSQRQHGVPNRPASEALRGSVPESKAELVPLPDPYTPGAVIPEQVGIIDPGSKLVFFGIGDHGTPKEPTAQASVATTMEALASEVGAAFVLSDGDLVYYDGVDWGHQFYEAYAKLLIPFISTPGNHDDPRGGDPPIPDFTDAPPLVNWMANMCAASPGVPPTDQQFEFGRHTQTLPSHDWTLKLDAITIVSAWTNVPEGGHLYVEQVAWLTQQLQGAPMDRPVLLNLHHPPLSIDQHHGGSPKMYEALEGIFKTATRVPDVVHTGHVHDYQDFEWQVAGGQTRMLVNGAGGYYNKHAIADDYHPGMEVEPGVVCQYADASQYGFVIFTVSGGKLSGEYVGVRPGSQADGTDSTYTRQVDTF